MLAPFVAHVEAETFAVYHDEYFSLTLSVAVGGDETGNPELTINLALNVEEAYDNVFREQTIDLLLEVGTYDNLHNKYNVQNLGLTITLTKGNPYNIIMVWDPYDVPKLTGKNYTYIIHLGLQGVDLDNYNVVVRFEGSYVTEKTTNASGIFEYWAVVGSPGMKTWTFTIYNLDGEEDGIIWKDTLYVKGGPDDGDDPPDGPGPDLPDLPTEPGSLFVVLDFFPIMVVFGIFGFIGMLIIGRIGILFGAVAALFVTTAMGDLPTWVLFFAILVTILVVVYRLKSGGSKVTVNGGNGA